MQAHAKYATKRVQNAQDHKTMTVKNANQAFIFIMAVIPNVQQVIMRFLQIIPVKNVIKDVQNALMAKVILVPYVLMGIFIIQKAFPVYNVIGFVRNALKLLITINVKNVIQEII